MRMMNRVSMCTLLVSGSVLLADVASAQQVQPGDLGVVQAPAAGSIQVPLNQVPLPIRHSAEVGFKLYEGGATLVSAQVDKDEVLAVYEAAAAH